MRTNVFLAALTAASIMVAGGGVAVSVKALSAAKTWEGRYYAAQAQADALQARLEQVQGASMEITISTSGENDEYTRSLSRQNRNLLNVRAMADGRKWDGQIGVDKFGHVIFSHPAYSVRAGALVLKNYERKHGINTVEALINRFCVGNREEYIAFLCRQLGVKPDEKISLTKQLHKLLPAMIRFETGENIGLEYTKIIDAVRG